MLQMHLELYFPYQPKKVTFYSEYYLIFVYVQQK